MRRTRRVLALCATAGALLAGAVPAAAGDDAPAARQQQDTTAEALDYWWPQQTYPRLETNVGKKVSNPGLDSDKCWPLPLKATACYKSKGDLFFVHDGDSDGQSAIAAWELMHTENSMSRQGVCRNPYGEGTWVRCNHEFRENQWGLWFSPGTSNGWDITNVFETFKFTKP